MPRSGGVLVPARPRSPVLGQPAKPTPQSDALPLFATRAELSALAAAVVANAVHFATAPSVRPEDRAAARRFLLADYDPRLELFTLTLGVDVATVRAGLRARLGALDEATPKRVLPGLHRPGVRASAG